MINSIYFMINSIYFQIYFQTLCAILFLISLILSFVKFKTQQITLYATLVIIFILLIWFAKAKNFIECGIMLFNLLLYLNQCFCVINKISDTNAGYSMKVYGTNAKTADITYSVFATKNLMIKNTKNQINKFKEDETIIGKIERIEFPFLQNLSEEEQKELNQLMEQLLK